MGRTDGVSVDGYCSRCTGIKFLVLGVLVLANVFWFRWDWWTLIGIVLVVGGLIRIAKPSCGCGGGCCMPPLEVARKKKR